MRGASSAGCGASDSARRKLGPELAAQDRDGPGMAASRIIVKPDWLVKSYE